jgi:hypothetical protein
VCTQGASFDWLVCVFVLSARAIERERAGGQEGGREGGRGGGRERESERGGGR